MTKLLLCCLLSPLFLVACKPQSESTATPSGSPETIVSSTPPFQTKEPEHYRATRIITVHTANGETIVTKTSIERDGDMRRHESGTESKRVVYLELPTGQFALLPEDKVYADLIPDTINDEQTEITPDLLLHMETENTSYQKIGTETIGGRKATKYRVVVNSSTAPNVSVSESLIWVDETLNMPVRSETTSANGTRITTELADIALDVDKRLFEVPDDYEKIAFKELRKRLSAPAAKGTE